MTFTTYMRQYLMMMIILIGIVFMPCIAYTIEPIATLGQRSPDKHVFITNDTILRTYFYGTNAQIIQRDTGEIIDEFGNWSRQSVVVFSPNGTHLAILDYLSDIKATTVRIWDVNTREKISEWESVPPITENATFCPTQPILATEYQHRIYLWNWETGEFIGTMVGERRKWEECHEVIFIHRGNTQYCSTYTRNDEMVFTPDGKYLIVASQRPDIELWDVEIRQLVGHFEGHTGNWVDGIAISPDGKHLASYEKQSNFVYMWDVASRKLLWREPIDERGISDLIFSKDSQYLYAAHHNVYIWNVRSGQQIDSFGSDYPSLRQMVLSPDGNTMLIQYGESFLRGGVVELWHPQTKHKLKEFADYTGGTVRLSHDGQTMATIESSFIKVWDVHSQKVRYVIPAQYSFGFFFDKVLAISSDNQRIAYSKYPGIEIVDLQSGKVEAKYQRIGSFENISFSTSGKWLAGTAPFGYLFLFDVSNRNRIDRVHIDFPPERHYFHHVVFSVKDKYMAASARKGEHNSGEYWILLWKREGDNFVFQYQWKTVEPDNTRYSTLAFATDKNGSTVLAAANKLDTKIWKISHEKAELLAILSGAGAPIVFSPDNRYLFVDQFDFKLETWDWQRSKRIRFPSMHGYRGISRDGSILVTTDKTGRYLIWDAEDLFSTLPYSVEPKDKRFVTLGQIKRDQLLQNFPNPFNPETWIPFRLADETDVTIQIYTPNGKLVRSINPGKLAAGDYSSQKQAVHWDGHNDKGEKVSSGVYLYTIKAGDYSATRKMLIRK